jgi:hypothetical protein
MYVAEAMKKEIVAGRVKTGDRLPPFTGLEKKFRHSRMTIQSAVNLLKEQGFITSEERKGLFVSFNPPHLKRYGFVLPADEERSWFWRCLVNEFPGVVNERQGESVIFRRVESVIEGEGDRESLLEQGRQQRLAGLIYPYRPPARAALACIPQVAISCVDFPQGGRVDLDVESFARQAVRWMLERGRKRIALMGLGDAPILESTERVMAKAGVPVPPAWRLLARYPPSANAITQLLMSLPKGRRPDGVIVVDDDIVEFVCAGLQVSGAELGRSLDVVSHVNWPWPAVAGLPLRRLGHDMRDTLRRGLDMIDAVRCGEPMPPMVLIPAVFEESVALSIRNMTGS